MVVFPHLRFFYCQALGCYPESGGELLEGLKMWGAWDEVPGGQWWWLVVVVNWVEGADCFNMRPVEHFPWLVQVRDDKG